jgi:hypothetical protein
MNWAIPPWVLAEMPWQWSQWAIDYQVACHDAENQRRQIAAAREKQRGG